MSPFIFRSLSHLELIFVCGVRLCSNFTDLQAAVQLSQHHLLKRQDSHFWHNHFESYILLFHLPFSLLTTEGLLFTYLKVYLSINEQKKRVLIISLRYVFQIKCLFLMVMYIIKDQKRTILIRFILGSYNNSIQKKCLNALCVPKKLKNLIYIHI